jgi:membrane associated rhomboid family serine protease
MMYLACRCGSGTGLPDDFVGELAECAECRRPFRVVAAGETFDPNDPLDARLTIRSGPQRLGEQLVLRGNSPIEIGKLPEKPISLSGTMVSRNHCQLVRSGGTWQIEDLKSTNGLFVNKKRVASANLKNGDVVHVGDYKLEFTTGAPTPQTFAVEEVELEELEPQSSVALDDVEDVYDLAEEPAAVNPLARPPALAAAPVEALGVDPCPSCGKYLPAKAVICIECGINIKTGRAILVSNDVDENAVHVNTENVVRILSFFIPFGLYPIASEGYGGKKPYAVWATAALTTLITIMVWFTYLGNGAASNKNLMLWCGREPTAQDIHEAASLNRITHWGDPSAFEAKLEEIESTKQLPIDQAVVEAYQQLTPEQRFYGEFHWYQLITNGFLHGGILHLAGNLLFLLVFGSRVNALIGQWKTAVLYLILMIIASWAEMISLSDGPPRPALGASGAIMGLAGIYFVLFPVHRMFMVIWLRLGAFFGLIGLLLTRRVAYKIWAVRGFWVVLFYIFFDVLATVLRSKDGIAHWAHLGGFIGGMVLALALLLARQVDAKGGDLLSAMLGKRAWALLGKPAARNAAAPASAAA